MAYLDLDELDTVFHKCAFWSAHEFNLAWFRRDDYMIASRRLGQSLGDAVRDCVEQRCGSRPEGPIRILTNVRRFGFGMNPVSFYYCFQPDGVALHSIVAEINNTPWNEQFAYVLPCGEGVEVKRSVGESAVLGWPPVQPGMTKIASGSKTMHRFCFKKTFHVSPFLDMDYEYDWRFSVPGKKLAVHMINRKSQGEPFDSTMILSRRAISPRELALDVLRQPLMTLKVFAAIYFQAARLWLKRTPSFSHPQGSVGEKIV